MGARALAKTIVIGGTGSGVGKTTVSLALMAALRRRGMKVQAFKVGPDFIDTGHHALVTGRSAHNLDGCMLSPEENRAIFSRYAASAQVAVVEGVMGLYDGADAVDETGSTTQMAKILGAPVLLVANASSLARSFAALVKGYTDFDPDLTWSGVLANQVGGGPAHVRMLAQAMTLAPKTGLLGCLRDRSELSMPERHLGLITAEEGGLGQAERDKLASWLEEAVNLDLLLESLPDLGGDSWPQAEPLPAQKVRLGVARDQAFCFYYQENLRRLEQAGAELEFFSPLQDAALPSGLSGLYLGGGYPEVHARELSRNFSMKKQIAEMGRAGMPIYAECGGMMYLGRELRDMAGGTWPMAGLLPLSFTMLPRLKALGYRCVVFNADTPLGSVGTTARGHEFHYSEVFSRGPAPGLRGDCYAAFGQGGPLDDTTGFGLGNTLASYVHLHFGSNPALAENLVDACLRWRG
ncbi:MAG: cobyrinate a,c-diamide synthase [Desulfarculus sp.]|nr:cobyrinate a,c-diamide synthase [Pseudomonadota bacterium]MBV1716607.1 cobyrinate a,c-diamide synthase [Desulfarculus sp.]MBU4574929.1 cobyrinate a,c-diamide synthase [Pseudomonadota bacterium]MBU4597735.1 cobyrinate a,c-diamide synthase [Pseudomonadota bacterium]MBV1736739.1 cobyrinate a,c-diamide synthase [Desulfarculus sp.]